VDISLVLTIFVAASPGDLTAKAEDHLGVIAASVGRVESLVERAKASRVETGLECASRKLEELRTVRSTAEKAVAAIRTGSDAAASDAQYGRVTISRGKAERLQAEATSCFPKEVAARLALGAKGKQAASAQKGKGAAKGKKGTGGKAAEAEEAEVAQEASGDREGADVEDVLKAGRDSDPKDGSQLANASQAAGAAAPSGAKGSTTTYAASAAKGPTRGFGTANAATAAPRAASTAATAATAATPSTAATEVAVSAAATSKASPVSTADAQPAGAGRASPEVPAPPPPPAPPAAPAAASSEGLQGSEFLRKAADHLSRIKGAMNQVLRKVEAARNEKDVVKLNCVAEKLQQVRQILLSAEGAETELQEALARDDGMADAKYSRIALARGKAEQMGSEADECVSQLALVVDSATEVAVEQPEQLPSIGMGNETAFGPLMASEAEIQEAGSATTTTIWSAGGVTGTVGSVSSGGGGSAPPPPPPPLLRPPAASPYQ
jgi:hypothetical protein